MREAYDSIGLDVQIQQDIDDDLNDNDLDKKNEELSKALPRNLVSPNNENDINITDFGIIPPTNAYQAQQYINKVDSISNAVISKLLNATDDNGKKLFTKEQVIEALENYQVNDNLSDFHIGNNVISFVHSRRTKPRVIQNDNGMLEPERNEYGDIIYDTELNPFCIRNKELCTGDLKGLLKLNGEYTDEEGIDHKLHEWKNLSVFSKVTDGHWGKFMLGYTCGKLYSQLGIKPKSKELEVLITAANSAYKQAQQMSQVTSDKFNQINNLSMKLFGLNENKQPTDNSSQLKTILSNLIMASIQHDINSNVSYNITVPSKGKREREDYSTMCDYYSGTVMSNFPTSSQQFLPIDYYTNRNASSFRSHRFKVNQYKKELELQNTALSDRITQVGKNATATFSLNDVNNIIHKQLGETPIYSEEQLNKLRNSNPNVREGFTSSNISSYANSPLRNVMITMLRNTLRHLPKYKNSVVNFNNLIEKRLTEHPVSNLTITPVTAEEMKAARQQLLSTAQCSLQTVSKKKSNRIWQDWRKQEFDYSPNETTPEGTKVSQPLHQIPNNTTDSYIDSSKGRVYNQQVFLNSPLFMISNNRNESKNTKLADTLEGKAGDPITVFHGNSYAGLGRLISSNIPVGTVFTNKLGHAVQYSGNNPNIITSDSKLSKEQCDGLVLMGEVMRGNTSVTHIPGKTQSIKNASTVITDANSNNNTDWEIKVNQPELFYPQYIMDVSTRICGINTSYNPSNETWRDYNNSYTKDGINTKIKWGEEQLGVS